MNRDPIKLTQAILDSVNLAGAKRDVSAPGHNPHPRPEEKRLQLSQEGLEALKQPGRGGGQHLVTMGIKVPPD